MSDKTSDKDQQLNISDVDLAKIAAALLGVEYPGDEYFDGSKTVENKSTVATPLPSMQNRPRRYFAYASPSLAASA